MTDAIASSPHLCILGFDPGRDKCGIAVRQDGQIALHTVVASGEAIAQLLSLSQQHPISLIVMGNQTTAREWQVQVQNALPNTTVVLVDERYSTLEARDRYWQMFPPQGLQKLVPQSLRSIPRPIDDIVAILLIERYILSHAC